MAANTRQTFITSLIAEFPDLRADLAACEGLLHREMGAFALFTQAAKDRGDLDTYARCLALAGMLFAAADAELAGAIRTSYVEHLDFEGSRGPAAWQLVPPRLQAVWNQIAAENRRLMALPQKHADQQPRQQKPHQHRYEKRRRPRR